MKITALEEYGLRCLLRFAHAGMGESLTIPDVAAAEGLSAPYVGKILALLRQGGLIESARGRSGGYHLAKPAEDVSLGMILQVLGEPLFDDPGYCQRHAGSETDGACVHRSGCTLRTLWQSLEQWMHGTLEGITLADLLQDGSHLRELLRSRLASVLEELPPLIHLTGRRPQEV